MCLGKRSESLMPGLQGRGLVRGGTAGRAAVRHRRDGSKILERQQCDTGQTAMRYTIAASVIHQRGQCDTGQAAARYRKDDSMIQDTAV